MLDGSTIFNNFKCVVCPNATFPTDNALYAHFVEKHTFEERTAVPLNVVRQQGLAICEHCWKVFLPDKVHPPEKCRAVSYAASAKNLQSRRKALVTQQFDEAKILSLEFGTHLSLPADFFSKQVRRVNQLTGDTLLQQDLRILLIMAVRAMKAATNDDEKLKAWAFFTQLPHLLLSNRNNEKDVSNAFVQVFSGNLQQLYNDVTQGLQNRSPFKNSRKDRRKQHQQQQQQQNQDAQDLLSEHTIEDLNLGRQVATTFLDDGNIGKAANRILTPSTRVAFTDPGVQDKLKTLLLDDTAPVAEQDLLTEQDTPPILSEEQVKTAVSTMRSTAAGITGWSPALIKAMVATPQGREAVTYITNALFAKSLPAEIYQGLSTSVLMLIAKDGGKGIRPIMIGDGWMRLMETCITQDIPTLSRDLPPLQMAIGVSGGNEDIVHLVRCALEAKHDYVAVKTDLTNAYGSVRRSAIFNAIKEVAPKGVGELTKWFLKNHLSSPSRYLPEDQPARTYSRGVAQGGPMSMFLFCRTLQAALLKSQQLIFDKHNGNGIVVASADDTTFLAPPAVAFEAVDLFRAEVAKIGLDLNPAKSATLVITPATRIEAAALATARDFPEPVKVLKILGSYVGVAKLEQDALIADINVDGFKRLAALDNPQIQMLLLRYSIISTNMFLTRTTAPDTTDKLLKKIRGFIDDALANIMGFRHINARVSKIASMSLAMGGLGLTDLHSIRHSAFYASNAHALHTWTRYLGRDNDIIAKWLDGSTRSSNQLQKCLEEQRNLVKLLNTTKIIPDPKSAANNANVDKAHPEAAIVVPLPPTLPQTLNQIPDLKRADIDKIQHVLGRLHSVIQFRNNWKEISKDDVAKRTQYLANSVPTSSIWLRVLPNNRKFKFNRFEYRFNMLQHFALDDDIDALLGLTPHHIPCACNKNAFRDPDDEDGGGRTPRATYQHLVNCIKEGAFTTRHTLLVNDCADAARSVGLTPLPEAQASKTPTATTHQHQIQQKLRFDVTVAGISNINILQCDVTVASHRQQEKQMREGCSNYNLYAANHASKHKLNKYKDAIYPDSESVVPLVAETSGAIHSGFSKFLEAVGTRVDGKAPLEANWTTPTFAAYWLAVISATLRRECARALQRLARKSLALSGQQGPMPSGLQPGGFDQ
jgi:hypothetical protein